MRRLILAALAVGGALTMTAGPAAADLSACDAASRSKSVDERIGLYTLCITKGGLGRTDRAGAYNNRGAAYLSKGDIDTALGDFDRAIQNDPTWGASYFNRARIRFLQGQEAGAEADLTEATKHAPAYMWPPSFMLRGILRRGRDDKAALADFDQAIRYDRKLPDAYSAKAWLLATSGDARVRDGKAAVGAALQGVALRDGAKMRDVLATAYAEAGQFDEAVATETEAIQKAHAANLAPTDIAEFEARLALFQQKQPYRPG